MFGYLTQYIYNNFGSKKGLLYTVKFKMQLLSGRFTDLQKIDFNSVKRLVFVCYGNICRSPFAEYYARAQGLNAISFGLHCKGNKGADPRVIAIAREQGIELEDHVTTNIKDYIAEEGDLIVVMEPKHLDDLKAAIGEVKLLTIAPLWKPWRTPYLHDPYNSNQEFFLKCISTLKESILTMKTKLASNRAVKI